MKKPLTIKERCAAGASLLWLVVGPIAAAFLVAGCGTPGKVRDIDLKGMYVNGYTETLAIGQGKLTSIPGEREAMAAHYEEDVAWLSPNKKTHSLDIFLVGGNTVSNASGIVESICKAFAEVAPTVSSNNTAAAATPTAFDLLGTASKSNADVKLAKTAAAQAAATAKAAATNAAAQAAATTNAVSAVAEDK
jgi:hypothetical protein